MHTVQCTICLTLRDTHKQLYCNDDLKLLSLSLFACVSVFSFEGPVKTLKRISNIDKGSKLLEERPFVEKCLD